MGDSPKTNQLFRAAIGWTFILTIIWAVSIIFSPPNNKNQPVSPLKGKTYKIDGVFIEREKILIEQQVMSFSSMKGRVRLRLRQGENTLKLIPTFISHQAIGESIVQFNPVYSGPQSRAYTRDKNGEEWELYPNNIKFAWHTSSQNPLYQKFLKNKEAKYEARFKTGAHAANEIVQTKIAFASMECPHGDFCASIL